MKKIALVLVFIFISSLAFAGQNVTLDSNRDTVSLMASFTTTTAVSTSPTLTWSKNGGALTSGSTYTVSTGKTFRLQSLNASCRASGSSPAASYMTLAFKVNGVQQGASSLVSCPTATAASDVAFPAIPGSTLGGVDYRGASTISFVVSLATWTNTNTPILNLSLFGYEY